MHWQIAAPHDLAMDGDALDTARDGLASRRTKAFLVARHGRIAYEWYGPDHGPDARHYTASMAKALVGGVSLMIALNDGRIQIDDPARLYVPAWRDDPRKSRVTIRHLATHSSGVEDAEADGLPHDELPGWKGAFWRQEPDAFTLSRDEAPITFEPGTQYAYSNPGMAMLSYCVTAAMGQDVRTLLRDRVMRPLGIADAEWSVGYGKTDEVDGLSLVGNWGGGGYTARATAAVGQWMLQRGEHEGRPLAGPEWVDRAVAYAGTPTPDRPPGNPQPTSGLGWWTNDDGVWPNVPRDAFAGAGAGNQVVLIVPSLDMVVVRNGALLGAESDGEGFWGGIERYLFDPVVGAVRDEVTPKTHGPKIVGVDWAPKEEIIRLAKGRNGDGSDNWPIAWAPTIRCTRPMAMATASTP
jgi:CubicO group peptidase (beta-lactamase class C family)